MEVTRRITNLHILFYALFITIFLLVSFFFFSFESFLKKNLKSPDQKKVILVGLATKHKGNPALCFAG